MVVKVKDEFVWLQHAETDDFFLVLKGRLTIELRGRELGRISRVAVEGVGTITFVYTTDPEGNILELQHWDR